MGLALELASQERPHPNPRVGAVLIDADGQIIGSGSHRAVGRPHAEVVALESVETIPAGSTLVVTLEPCHHQGRTGPCTEAIIEAGIKTVVIGAIDPDTRVAGAGRARLLAAGVDVIDFGDNLMIESADPAYFHHRRTGRPRFTIKAAMTLDGQVAALDGTSQWISGEEARLDGHKLRAEADAVVVGSGTVLADDPLLTVRIPGYDGPQPRPVVVKGVRPLPDSLRVFKGDPLIFWPEPSERRVDLGAMAADLAGHGLLEVLVEGGSGLQTSLLAAGLVDRGVFYLAAKLAGGIGRGVFGDVFGSLDHASDIDIVDVTRLGSDLRVEWVPRR